MADREGSKAPKADDQAAKQREQEQRAKRLHKTPAPKPGAPQTRLG